jgi:hypothetical protein
MKPLIKIADTQFAHGKSWGTGSLQIPPKSFDWYRGEKNIFDMIVITESCWHLVDTFKERIKIAMVVESPQSDPAIYEKIKDPSFYNKFDYILCFDRSLASLSHKFIWYPYGGCWILPEQRQMYEKTKNISIIASSKTNTEGHKLRHAVIEKYRSRIDGIYGNGYQFIENKLDALRDYRYSIVIENDNCDDFFTEKIIDCFACGTMPIYWGTKNIEKYFDRWGLISFDTIDSLGNVFGILDNQFYNKFYNGVRNNFDRVGEYAIPEDWLWQHFFQPLIFDEKVKYCPVK